MRGVLLPRRKPSASRAMRETVTMERGCATNVPADQGNHGVKPSPDAESRLARPVQAPLTAWLLGLDEEMFARLSSSLDEAGFVVERRSAPLPPDTLSAPLADLVITRLPLPETSALLADLRSHPGRAHCTVLAWMEEADVAGAFQAGANGAVAAPVPLLLEQIATVALRCRQARNERVAREAVHRLGACDTPQAVLSMLGAILHQDLGYDRVSAVIYDGEDANSRFWRLDHHGRLSQVVPSTRDPAGAWEEALAWQRNLTPPGRDCFHTTDIQSDTPEHLRPLMDPAVRQSILVALRVADQAIGQIRVDQHPLGRPIHAEESAALVILAAQTALAWERARLAEESAAMARISEAFSTELDEERLYELILRQAARVLPCDHGCVLLYEEDAAVFVATWGEPRITPRAARFPHRPQDKELRAPDSSASYLPDTHLATNWRHIAPLVGPYALRSVIQVPLIVDGEARGAFWLGSRAPRRYAERHLRLATAFAERANHALQTARLYAAERERAQEKERFRLLFTQNPIPVFVLHRGTRRIQEVNEAALALYGYTREEFLALRVEDLLTPDGIAEITANVDRSPERLDFRGVREHVRKGGEVFDVHLTVHGFFHGQGETVLVIVRDVTEERRQEAESAALARVSEALARVLDPREVYQLALEQAAQVLPCDHASVLVFDGAWAVVAASWGPFAVDVGTPVYRLAEWSFAPDITTTRRPILVPDTALDPTWNHTEPLVGEHHVRSAMIVPLVIDGLLLGSFNLDSFNANFYTERHMRVAAAFGERVAQALRTARLYSAEQARARAAEEVARLRSDFVATVSHELRSPITAIIGYAELLVGRWLQMSDSYRLEQLVKVMQAAHRQQRVVEDFLLLTQMDSGAPPPQAEPVPLATLAERASDEVRAGYPALRIEHSGPESLEVWVPRGWTMQILVNLLDNAAKYSPEGSAIALDWEQMDGQAVIRVRDQGPGLPPKGRERLFSRFGRIAGSPTRHGRGGTGLGLYLGRQLAAAMGGDLDLETTGATGSVFRLRLPLSAPAGAEPDPGGPRQA